MAEQLRDTIPTFGEKTADEVETHAGLDNMTALARTSFARTWGEAGLLIVVAIVAIGGLEMICRVFDVPAYTFPKPSEIGTALYEHFRPLYWDHLLVTLQVLAAGYVIGAVIGIVLAAVITQFPFVEKVITPYILLLVTTPMIALVPLLVQKMGIADDHRRIDGRRYLRDADRRRCRVCRLQRRLGHAARVLLVADSDGRFLGSDCDSRGNGHHDLHVFLLGRQEVGKLAGLMAVPSGSGVARSQW
jgi:ABC-type proline/glycine betaine transport system permease subunit